MQLSLKWDLGSTNVVRVVREAAGSSGIRTGHLVAQMYGKQLLGACQKVRLRDRAIGGRKTGWCKFGMLLGSGMIGGAHDAECYSVVSSLWHAVWPNSAGDVAVPRSFAWPRWKVL